MGGQYLHLLDIRCGRCGATWAGGDRAHCAACHETWDSTDLFDQHRQDDRGIRPQLLGLIPTRNGIWQRTQFARQAG